MATISMLRQRQALIQLEVELERYESASRQIYACPHVVTWINDSLSTFPPKFSEGMQDLDEQLDFLLHEYVRGSDIAHYERAHIMEPHDPGVYELKSPDIRIFGWFYEQCSFIAANIDTAARCKDHQLYAGYRNDTVRRRDKLDLDEPKFIVGDINYVLCT